MTYDYYIGRRNNGKSMYMFELTKKILKERGEKQMKIYTVMVDMLDRVGYNKTTWVESKFSGRIHLDRKAADRELLEAEAAALHSKNLGDVRIKEEVIEI